MIDMGIFEVQKNDDGRYVVDEQLGATKDTLPTIDAVVDYIRGCLESVEEDAT